MRRSEVINRFSEADLRFIARLIEHPNGPGYVLDFSNRTFASFFRDTIGIDIDNDHWSQEGGSKGKRLIFFLRTGPEAKVLRVLKAIWIHRREMLLDRNEPDPIQESRGRLVRTMRKVGYVPKPKHAPSSSAVEQQTWTSWKPDVTKEFLQRLIDLSSCAPHQRGFAFETFLHDLLKQAHLDPRPSFRNTGEQIDGSFMLHGEPYLLEAKWTGPPISISDLHVFHGKVEAKAGWARGLFVSISGFSENAFADFGSGKRIICMDGSDLHLCFEHAIPLGRALELKVRRAAESGRSFVPLRELIGI